MRMVKKLTAVLLTVVLLMGMACVPVGAEEIPLITTGQWYVYLNAGDVAICAFIPEATSQYYIGSYVSGVPESQYAVLDENAQLVREDKSGMYLTLTAGKVYYIAVAFWSQTQSGRVDFHIYNSATAITADPSAPYSDSFKNTEYTTWYAFTPDRTNYYTLESVNGTENRTVPSVTLYNSKGTVMATSAKRESDGEFQLSALLQQGNTYYYKLQYSMMDYIQACKFTLKSERYPDVSPNQWYYEAVEYVSEKGFMKGYASGTFGPADSLQRQDFVVTLARVAGVDLTAYSQATSGLTDVQVGSYYAPAVAWGVEQGIITGYQNGKFGVGDPITREQVCTILYRYVGSPDVEDVDSTLSAFPDNAMISEFAKTPMAWAVQNGVMSGMGSGKMAPVVKASRAQVATIVMRMDQKGML